MNRSLFLSITEGEAVTRCHSAKVGVSAIEPLPRGGVRLVCMSVDGAATMRRRLKSHLIVGDVTRAAVRPSGPLW